MDAPTNGFTWPGVPYPALLTAVGTALLAAVVVVASKYFDPTGGPLTVTLLIVIPFVAATFASMIYAIPQTPSTELLLGSLATALGATVAYWLGRK